MTSKMNSVFMFLVFFSCYLLGLNLMSQFNLENVTKYNKKTDDEVNILANLFDVSRVIRDLSLHIPLLMIIIIVQFFTKILHM